MAKSGCLDYVTTQWQVVKPDVYERQLSYKFNYEVSVFGGEVRSTQRKMLLGDIDGWIVNEAMALHDIPFGDHFRVSQCFATYSASVCSIHLNSKF